MRSIVLGTLAAVALTAACHSNPPATAATPDPTAAELAMHKHMQDSLDAVARVTADSLEQARQLARAEQMRADSIAQAQAAADAIARELAAKSAALRDELTLMVHFDVARAQIDEEGIAALDRKVAILAANPEVRLRITGACDERGSDEYNMVLGERRAAAVKKYLTSKGVDLARLDITSTGESSPLDSGSTETAWALNRRTEFAILGGDSPLAMND
jgi:peptidoglycan-associated lipoprotein